MLMSSSDNDYPKHGSKKTTYKLKFKEKWKKNIQNLPFGCVKVKRLYLFTAMFV